MLKASCSIFLLFLLGNLTELLAWCGVTPFHLLFLPRELILLLRKLPESFFARGSAVNFRRKGSDTMKLFFPFLGLVRGFWIWSPVVLKFIIKIHIPNSPPLQSSQSHQKPTLLSSSFLRTQILCPSSLLWSLNPDALSLSLHLWMFTYPASNWEYVAEDQWQVVVVIRRFQTFTCLPPPLLLRPPRASFHHLCRSSCNLASLLYLFPY